MRLDWTPWGVHGAFHLAQQKGWYRQAGLDVSLEDGNGSVTTVQIVGAGDSFDLGHAALASAMIAREKGMPVKAVAVFARQSDIGLLVPADAGISGPAQLKARRSPTPPVRWKRFHRRLPGGGQAQEKRSGADQCRRRQQGIHLCGGAGGRGVLHHPVLPAGGVADRPSNAVRFADFGLNMPSFGLFANESKLAQRRDAIARFASVSARAWEYIYAGHQDEAVAAILAQRPQSRLDRKVLRGQIDALQPYFGQPAAGARLGAIVPQDWTQAVATLSTVGLISADAQAASFYEPGLVHAERYDSLVQP